MITTRKDVWLSATMITVTVLALVGVITYVTHLHEGWWDDMALSLMWIGIVGFPVAFFAMSKARQVNLLTEELRRLVERDRLTNVSTRDHFFQRMESDPAASGVSLMVDIDHFKSVNDTHGHLAGDEVIRRVAQILRENCRPDDTVCRFGGEEFLVFLNDADAEIAAAIAERIRKVVAGSVLAVEDAGVSFTVSIGASMKVPSENIDQAIKRADDALYRAKRAGRNRVVLSWRASSQPLGVPA